MNVAELILKKRDGFALVEAEIAFLIKGYTAGRIPDYQMAAFCMAVFHRGMAADETLCLTRAMQQSGSVLDFSSLPGLKLDKHSTGGVGDKTSLIIAPLVAAAGAYVPMFGSVRSVSSGLRTNQSNTACFRLGAYFAHRFSIDCP